MPRSPDDIRKEILCLTREFVAVQHKSKRPVDNNLDHREFIPGESIIQYAGRVFDEDEVEAAVNATLEFWLTLGDEGAEFEKQLAIFLETKKAILTNSGSSANLLAFSALTSHKLGDRRLKQGDEVITVAAAFPTTVAPIIQNGCVPVFIDSDPITLNIRVDKLNDAFVSGKTKAVFIAHTLGNPFDLKAVIDFCRFHNLWLIEDNCDALGSRYNNQLTGTFGDLSTQSFYPPHHITLGEGGAVNVVNDIKLKILVESFRDWGRDCWCPSGKDNTCKKRYKWKLGELEKGYDHKYIYSHLGYNLKPLEIQAAIGLAQLKKLPSFINARSKNWQTLRKGLAHLDEFLEFQLPTHASGWTEEGFIWDASGNRSDCSWFGFLIIVKSTAPFTRTELANYLESKKINSRMLFGGNIIRQPAFMQLKKDRPNAFRVVGSLEGADYIMKNALFLGVYPGLTKSMIEYTIHEIDKYIKLNT